MSKADMEALFAGLAGEGTTEARGLGFTLESAKAREKLQEFAMAQPENFQLLAIAGLYALGCRHFQLTIDADDFRIQADQPLPREPFVDLWSFVSRGSGEAIVIGCRLLAMAILTSVRLDEMEWRLESSDPQGPWQLKARVKKGTLSDLVPVPKEGGEEASAPGVVLWAKRKALSQIALRFVTRWWSGEQKGADEALLRERLFLPREASLTCNGHSLTPLNPPSAGVLAVLQTGQAPSLVECATTHHIERDYSLCVMLCHPSAANDARLPGQSNHVQWIWNGLRMDSTILGGELENFRAFVWATELRPDLSFTSLVDNRDKQALERTVRSMARELLDRFTRALTVEIRAQRVPVPATFTDQIAMIRDAITRRVGGNVDWKRLASLNRGLTECPLLVGSGPDGVARWFSLAQIRDELVQGRQVAVFAGDYESFELPSWPGRPLVIFSSRPERDFLKARLAQFSFIDAQSVRRQMAQLVGAAVSSTTTRPSQPALAGVAKVEQYVVSWTLEGGESKSPEPGVLIITGPGAQFADHSLSLPRGFHAELNADLERSYHGGLLDKVLSDKLRQALLASVIDELGRRSEAVAEEDYTLAARILALHEPLGQTGQSAPWLIASTLDGQRRRVSPDALRHELGAQRIPLYVAGWDAELHTPSSARLASAPVVLTPPEAEVGLARLMDQTVHSAHAFRTMSQRPAPERDSAQQVWQGTIDGDDARALSPALESLTLGIARHLENAHRSARVLTWLEGNYLVATTSRTIYPFVRISVNWTQGWPDGEAKARLGEPEGEEAEAILRRACLTLAEKFFAEVSAQEIYAVNQELMGTLMFDLLSEPSTADSPCLILANGSKVSLSELPHQEGTASYFTTPPLSAQSYSPTAVYLPGPLLETISLLSELNWQLEVRDQLLMTFTSPPSAAKPKPPAPEALAAKARISKEEQPTAPQSVTMEVPSGPEPSSPADPRRTVIVSDNQHPAAPSTPQPSLHPPSPPSPPGPPAPILDGPESEGPGDLTPGQQLARVYSDIDGTCHEFEAYLLSARIQSQQPQALSTAAQHPGPILGAPALKALQTPAGSVFLLSALSSLFHRQQDDGAAREQALHAKLLSAAGQLPRHGIPGSPGAERAPENQRPQ